MSTVHVIGAGLAGCEAAYALAQRGHRVLLFEQKPAKRSPAHKSDLFAELVCSNSLKAMRIESAAGLLKAEMRLLGSLCLQAADCCAVPAGGALAVDRDRFAATVTERICSHPNIQVVGQEVTAIAPDIVTIIATGPLTEGALAGELVRLCGAPALSFYDAAAPIVTAESIDLGRVHAAARYGRGDADYLNCYFDKETYEAFWQALVSAETATLHDFDLPVYEGCMPIERLARRGIDSMRFGPLKPVGLTDPETGHRPWAAVQLRKENTASTLYNLVGFQTNLTFLEQQRVFRMIPGLANASFVRFGVMHRNTFLESPKVLLETLRLKQAPNVFVAGQLTGTEGYMESAMCGIFAARFAHDRLLGRESALPSRNTMCGALLCYITTGQKEFQPMGANMGLLPPLAQPIRDKQQRYTALAERALADMEVYCHENCD